MLNLTPTMQRYYRQHPDVFREAIAQSIDEIADDAKVTDFKFKDIK